MASSPAEAFDALASRLDRWPDAPAHDLVAADRSDRVLLEAAGAVSDAVVIGDRYGAIALSILAAHPGSRIRAHQDPLTGERALAENARRTGVARGGLTWHGLEPGLAAGAGLVLLQLPRGLDALDEIAGVVAGAADPAVELVAVGRTKHMTPRMNAVLGRHFRTVIAERAVGKSRVLRARAPRPGTAGAWPRAARDDAVGLEIRAHGAAFAGPAVDIGTRFLLSRLGDMPHAESVMDLGCGTGILASAYAAARPAARVLATDRSWAAVESARATVRANGLGARVEVVRDVGAASQADAAFGLVLLNPPFHSGAAVTDTIAPELFRDAARVLAPGGELWAVWNSHMRYRPQLERLVGPTREVARDATFTVTASTRRGG
ncbi:class I SAM-dependent methyltransferase [Microbacterium sp. ZXX196]|uniref:class I SAM-dependent methyltransferase n=1 Tax=Microbacterium sp. ZXX196 TaxID=2609291 RepID=UPI0012B94B42|nr:methyltransferase [Microbacterium sp. ZXX196]MTE24653.1 methyltransferase [Microbacterium sp. ZXX196]